MRPSGKGILQYNVGDVYQGMFHDGVQKGKGTFKSGPLTFVGQWSRGQKVEGSEKNSETGDTFVGTYLDNKRDCGVAIYKNGDEFSGEF